MAAATPLFRQEALAARYRRHEGEILIAPLPSALLLACVATAMVLTTVLAVIFGTYTKKVALAGYLTPQTGVIRVQAPLSGIAVNKRVKEGQKVDAGTILFSIRLEQQATDRGAIQSTFARLAEERKRSLVQERAEISRLQVAESAALNQKVAALQVERQHVERELGIQEQRRSVASEFFAKLQDLKSRAFISDAHLKQKTEDLLEQQARLEALKRTQLALERDIAMLAAEIEARPLRDAVQLAALDRSIALVDHELAESAVKRQIDVPAPASGFATAVSAQEGQYIQTGESLVVIVPEESLLEGEFFAPSRAVGFIAPGQRVLIRYQAYPFQKFGRHDARVVSVSRTALSPAELPAFVQKSEPLYRVTVALSSQTVTAYGKAQLLQPGMTAEADFLLDKRRIIEWMFEPFYSITGWP